VIGIDMTPEMVTKAQATADALGLSNVEFREAFAEALPIDDGWADVVISNGAINLCTDKRTVFAEIHRVLRPGGALQFADIANGRPCHPQPCATSTCGPPESPAGCPVRAGRRCSKTPDSPTSPSDPPSTTSAAPTAKNKREPSRCTATRSSPSNNPEPSARSSATSIRLGSRHRSRRSELHHSVSERQLLPAPAHVVFTVTTGTSGSMQQWKAVPQVHGGACSTSESMGCPGSEKAANAEA
jgi:hypothetical protein